MGSRVMVRVTTSVSASMRAIVRVGGGVGEWSASDNDGKIENDSEVKGDTESYIGK